MFVKELGSNQYGVFADESCTIRLGTAERVEREWYFQAAPQYGGKWAFGVTIGDAVRQANVLNEVHSDVRIVRRKELGVR